MNIYKNKKEKYKLLTYFFLKDQVSKKYKSMLLCCNFFYILFKSFCRINNYIYKQLFKLGNSSS